MMKIYSFMCPTLSENERPIVHHVVAESFERAILVARSADYVFTSVTEGPECLMSE